MPGCWDYVKFMGREGTPVLGLPFSWVFAPFVAPARHLARYRAADLLLDDTGVPLRVEQHHRPAGAVQVEPLAPDPRLGDQHPRVAAGPVEGQLQEAPGLGLGAAVHQPGKPAFGAVELLPQAGLEGLPQGLGGGIGERLVVSILLFVGGLADGVEERREGAGHGARRAGIPVLLMTYGYNEGVAVDTEDCDGLLSSFLQLPDLLD